MRHEDILVLNDGSPLLTLIGVLLKAQGHEVILTDQPKVALKICASHPLGLIVAKLNGDQIDRLEVLRMVKNLNPKVTIVVLSDGYGFPVSAYKMVADDYIHLPCRAAGLWSRIARLATEIRSAPQTTPAPGRLLPINMLIFSKFGLMLHDLQVSLTTIANRLQSEKYKIRDESDNGLETMVDATLAEMAKMMKINQKVLNNFQGPGEGLALSPDDLDQEPLILKDSSADFGNQTSQQLY